MNTLSNIFETINNVTDLVEKIKKLLGLIEDTDAIIIKMANSELNAGIKHLKAVSIANTEKLREKYLDQALAHFVKAIEIEEEERLVDAYIGLAACYHFLKDKQNAKRCLSEFADKDIILKVKFSITNSNWLNDSRNRLNTFKSLENYFNSFVGLLTVNYLKLKNFPFEKILKDEEVLKQFIQASEKAYAYDETLRTCKRQLKILQRQREAREELEQYKLLDM